MSKLLLVLLFSLLPLSSFASEVTSDEIQACHNLLKGIPGAQDDDGFVTIPYLSCVHTVTTKEDGSEISATGCFGTNKNKLLVTVIGNTATAIYFSLIKAGIVVTDKDENGVTQPDDMNPRTSSVILENFVCKLK